MEIVTSKSKFKFKLTKDLARQQGVPAILTAYKAYPLIFKILIKYFVYCDIVDNKDSYSNAYGSQSISTPSNLLAVVPSARYPSLKMKSHLRSFINDLDLSITNMDGSSLYFGMY